jgi:hypothetical protein
MVALAFLAVAAATIVEFLEERAMGSSRDDDK